MSKIAVEGGMCVDTSIHQNATDRYKMHVLAATLRRSRTLDPLGLFYLNSKILHDLKGSNLVFRKVIETNSKY